MLPPDVVKALAELPSSTARRMIDFWTGTAIDAGRPVVRVAWLPRGSRPLAGSPVPERVTVVAMHGETKVFNRAGAADRRVVCLSCRRVEGDLHHVRPRQRHRRSRRPSTRRAGPVGCDVVDVVAAVYSGRRTHASYRGLNRGPNALPYAGREFVRTDRLVIRFAFKLRLRRRPRSSHASPASGGRIGGAPTPAAPRRCPTPLTRNRVAAHLHRQRRLPDAQ